MRHAGGWLFDQVAAGWEATVCTAETGAARALRILGARPAALAAASAVLVAGPGRLAIAVDAGLYEADEHVRGLVREVREHARADVLFWGEAGPGTTRHRLSVAARAFKFQAVGATGRATRPPVRTEEFLSWGYVFPSGGNTVLDGPRVTRTGGMPSSRP